MKKHLLSLSGLFMLANISNAQCADEANVHAFTYDGTDYEIVKENKTYANAAACAVERGGVLARVDSDDENTILFDEITAAGVVAAETVAPDGGGGSYLWLGGTDANEEGKWLWDGNNDGFGDQFWEGLSDGTPVGGLYNNWGDEPDDFGGGQDGLGLSVNGWPLGVAGQWNDVDDSNELYFIIEMTEEDVDDSGVEESQRQTISIYPNPAVDMVYLKTESLQNISKISILDTSGKLVLITNTPDNNGIDVSHLEKGIYFFEITLNDGSTIVEILTK